MRLIYIDPRLIFYAGHHAPLAEKITARARGRGIETIIVGNTRAIPYVCEQLGVLPLFRLAPATDGDPYCGFMSAFFAAARMTTEDLAKLPPVGPDDIIFFTTFEGAQLLGLVEWLTQFAAGSAPTVIAEFIADPGLESPRADSAIKESKRVWRTPDPRINPFAAALRFAALRLATAGLPRLHFVTAVPAWVEAYSELAMRKVHLFSTLPLEGPKKLFKRGARKRLTIVTVGYQWSRKGFSLIPDIFTGLLARPENLRLVAHNCNPANDAAMQATGERLAAMAASDERVIFDNRVLNGETYQALLDAADILLCPYDAEHYRTNTSGVLIEAIANAIPVVTPAHTWLSAEAEHYDTGVTFSESTADSVRAATERILVDYESYAARAFTAAERWAKEKGCGKFLDEVLDIAARRDPD